MPRYRALVSTYKSTEMAEDRVTNSLYFDDTGVTTGADGLAEDIATVFATFRQLPPGFDRVNCRMYDMGEPAPREIQGEFTHTSPTVSSSPGAPREVALCLSFFSERNLPRNRGRIYIGPWSVTHMNERPSAGPIGSLEQLKTDLANIGGTDVEWCVFSPTTGPASPDSFKKVSAGWVDNEWDTQRSRGLRATARNAWEAEG